jgi:hypothetical protein
LNILSLNESYLFQVELKPLENSKPIQISGSNFEKPFTLANVHFHWGDKKESEHIVDNKSFAL